MNDYLLGVLVGLDMGPIEVEDSDIGKPVYVEGEHHVLGHGGGGGGGHGGGGGGGGGHGGGGHGGGHHGGGFGRGWGGPWGGWWGGPDYVETVEIEPSLRCVRYNAQGKCLEYAPSDVLGQAFGEILGMEDIQSRQREMDQLKAVTVSIGNVLLRYGQQAISRATQSAQQPWYKANLPGETARKNVQGHLQWHADALAKLSATPNAMYESGDDLKKYVLAAFVEQNAAEEGAADPTWKRAWSDWGEMWVAVAKVIASLPRTVAKAVGSVASGAIEAVTGLPVWAWLTIGLGTVGLVGLLAWKIANSRAGVAAISGFAGRGRR